MPARPAAPAIQTEQATLTATIVLALFIALGAGIWLARGRGITRTDLLTAVVFYIATGLGVVVGFRRPSTATENRPERLRHHCAGAHRLRGDGRR